MIVKQKSIDKIKPIFKEYLNYMSQFFEIFDHTSWCEGALKNLQRYRAEDDHHIYVLMERGIDVDDGKKLRILSILVLILIGIYFIKRAFL